jgi:copper transport protein
VRRAAAIAVLAAIWLVAGAPGASAHALLVRSTPGEGEQLDEAPQEIVLAFTEPPDVALSSVEVLDTTGASVEAGAARGIAGSPLQLQIPVRDLAQGVYTVNWRVLSRTDGHITAGAFAFGVGVRPEQNVGTGEAPPGVRTPSPTPLAVIGRWGIYSSLAVLLGAAVVGTFVQRRVPERSPWMLVGAWLVGAVSLVLLTLGKRSAVGVSLGQLLGSDTGGHFVAMGIALALLGLGVTIVVVAPRWTSLPPLGLAAVGAMLVHVLGGHANAPSSVRGVNLGLQWIHVVAVGVWIGGLVWLLVLLRRTEGPERAAAVRRFSLIAGLSLGTVAITGFLRMLDEVGGIAAWGRLISTDFGITLAIKIVLFAALLALGARNRFVNVPGLSRGSRPVSSLRRTVSAELAIAAGVFGVTGVLTELPPADQAATAASSADGAPALVVTANDFATTTRVTLAILPGTAGPNRFEARITDFDTGEPLPAERVSLRFSLPDRAEVGSSTLELDRESEGTWVGEGANLSLDGRWRVVVLVQGSADAVEVELEVEPRPPPQRIEATEIQGAPTLYTITLAGGISVQGYVDPGRPGPNEVHFTFFDPDGDELPLASAVVEGRPEGATAEEIPVRRFSPGHFTAAADLSMGSWRFTVRAETEDGRILSAYFDETIGG